IGGGGVARGGVPPLGRGRHGSPPPLASPHSDTAPPSHGKPAFAVEVAGQRPALPRVQGCKPCRTPP
ncbi:hypothetical protein EGI98_17330, partial [Stenotrophomonas maltophilia]